MVFEPNLSRRMTARSTMTVAALLLVFAMQLIHVAHVYSLNWDEAHHLYDGYNIWTHDDYRLNAEVPPLVKLTAALPLLHMHLAEPQSPGKTQALNAFLGGRNFVLANGGDRIVLPARMVCMLYSLLLALLLYFSTREMFGTVAASTAILLFVFDPNVLAHGTLISTDVACACFFFAAVYAFYRFAKHPTAGRLVLTGFFAGLAMSAKFTGIFIIPLLVILAVAEAVFARSTGILWRRLAACAAILLCGWVMLWAFYRFRYAPAPQGLELSPSLAPYIAAMPGRGGAALSFLARWHLLPEPYLWGLAYTKYTEFEFTSYLFGRMYRHGPWLYFPAAFLIKSTLPLLILLALAPVLWLRRRSVPARELYFLLIPVLFYFALISSSYMDIGARHLMPIYPFLYELAGAVAARAFARSRPWAVAAAALLLWQVVTTVRAAPDFMAYGNEAWGGPSGVHHYLSDANTDWGQQLKAVKLYLDQNHIHDCWFAYFADGAVQPADYGIPCKRLPTGSSLWWFELPMDVPPVITGTVLISDSDLEGIESGDGPLNWFEPFRGLTPVSTIQHGVYVYQGTFAVPLMSALVDVRRSGELAKQGQPVAALAAARQAVALAPGSAITQLSLAGALAAQQQWSEALIHYQLAGDIARSIRPDLQEDIPPQADAGIVRARSHMSPQSN